VRTSVMGAMVTGVLLVAGAAMAQTAGPMLGSASPAIVPVTGPSTVPEAPGAAKPEMTLVGVSAKVANGEGPRKGPAGQPAATAPRPAPRTVKKAAHKPAAKPTAKKASAGKHLAKGAGPAKGQGVGGAKAQPVVHRAAVKKPMPATKGPAKGATPPQPVLPRV
jgi:hypothetical protein